MEHEFDNQDMVPTLTLEPELEEVQLAPKEETAPVEAPVPQPVLTPQEQKMVADFAAKIDLENTNQVLQYGAAAQKKMAESSRSLTKKSPRASWASLKSKVTSWSS